MTNVALKKRDDKFNRKPKLSVTNMDMTTFTRLTERLDLVEDRNEQLQKQNQKMEDNFEKLLEQNQ